MQPAGRRGLASSYKPFLHHVTKTEPERRRAIKLKTSPPRPKVLTVKQIQTILDACEHLRDRLLFALLLDVGMRIGEALGLRHEDMGIAEREVTVVPRDNGAESACVQVAALTVRSLPRVACSSAPSPRRGPRRAPDQQIAALNRD